MDMTIAAHRPVTGPQRGTLSHAGRPPMLVTSAGPHDAAHVADAVAELADALVEQRVDERHDQ